MVRKESAQSRMSSQTNGRSWLLWANTILTLVLFPVLGFMGTRIWDKLEINSDRLIRVEEKQIYVIKTVDELKVSGQESVKRLEKLESKP